MTFSIGDTMNWCLNTFMPYIIILVICYICYLPLQKTGAWDKITEFFSNTYSKAFGSKESNSTKEKSITYE